MCALTKLQELQRIPQATFLQISATPRKSELLFLWCITLVYCELIESLQLLPPRSVLRYPHPVNFQAQYSEALVPARECRIQRFGIPSHQLCRIYTSYEFEWLLRAPATQTERIRDALQVRVELHGALGVR